MKVSMAEAINDRLQSEVSGGLQLLESSRAHLIVPRVRLLDILICPLEAQICGPQFHLSNAPLKCGASRLGGLQRM